MPVPTATAAAVDAFGPPNGGGSLLSYPPGIDADGVTDVEALAAAHARAVAPTPWDLLLVYGGSADLLHPDRDWVGSRQTVDRSSDSRYWYRVTGLDRTGPDSFESVIYDDFADDRYNYRRMAGSAGPTYRRTLIPQAGETGLFVALSAAYIERYLSTTDTRVGLVQYGHETRYRIVATGTPTHVAGPVEDYAAVAVVDRRGLVTRLEVQYTRPGTGDDPPTATPPPGVYPALGSADATVQFRMVFRDVGTATVGVPPWYATAKNETEGAPVGPWPDGPSL